jgi:hypothetical protein
MIKLLGFYRPAKKVDEVLAGIGAN